MSPKTQYEIRTIGKELLLEMFSLPMLLQVYILLTIYKWTALGPKLFHEQVLQVQNTSYEMLRLAWLYEIWPLVKWLPLAILVNVLVKKLVRKMNF